MQEKTSQSRVENQQTQPTYDTKSGIEPGLHWWEASALATLPPLISYRLAPGNSPRLKQRKAKTAQGVP